LTVKSCQNPLVSPLVDISGVKSHASLVCPQGSCQLLAQILMWARVKVDTIGVLFK